MEKPSDEIQIALENLRKVLPQGFPAGGMKSLKDRLVELRSTEEELENIERQHRLGYIKDDDYLHRHDQLNLRKNFLIDNIKEMSMTPLTDAITDDKSKSIIRKMADAITSYKDVINVLAEIAGSAARGFVGGR